MDAETLRLLITDSWPIVVLLIGFGVYLTVNRLISMAERNTDHKPGTGR